MPSRSLASLASLLSRLALAALLAVTASNLPAQSPAPRRPLVPGDIYRLKRVSDPQVSPEGDWVAYVVSTADSVSNKNDSDVWMVKWDGSRQVRLTSTPESESHPRWSPDRKSVV